MALVIHMKKEQRIIINGAVLENVSGRTVSIAVKNEAAILRSEDVLTADAALTPASRVYFALQCAYLFPERKRDHLGDFEQLLASYLEAAPSAREIAARVLAAIEAGNYYGALKQARCLIEHEGEILSRAQALFAEEQGGGAAGSSAGSSEHKPLPLR
jgi:flagellar biosynthesis repressor protein FlbT